MGSVVVSKSASIQAGFFAMFDVLREPSDW
jgi:hypothetical protein